MTTSINAPTSRFHDDLTAILPRLRRHGLSLTHDRHATEDLVQNTVMRALAAQHSFQPGTNFGGWINMILRNEFVSGIRRKRLTVPFDDVADEFIAVAPPHEDQLMVHELAAALGRLPRNQRNAILLATLSGLNYDQIAEALKCRPGTIKSRISRARQQLKADLMGVAVGDKRIVPHHDRPSLRRAPTARRPSVGNWLPPLHLDPVMQMAAAQ
jgi:RNA polymerase sigma-70 factor, ECF subfamily